MSRLSHHANARGATATGRSQPLPPPSQNIAPTRDRYYQGSGSQGSELQDYHMSQSRSRPSSGHSYYSAHAPRTPPASLSHREGATFSPSWGDHEPFADVHNLRSGTFGFRRSALRPTSQSGSVFSPMYHGTSASPQRPTRAAQDTQLTPGVSQASQARPPTPLEPQTTHIRAWLHRLETSVNSIRNEFEAFRASHDSEKESGDVMKDKLSATLEACRQLPQALAEQTEIFNKNLTTEITSVLLKSNPQRGTAVTNHITAMERKLAELELRICTSTALGSSDSEELKGLMRAQNSKTDAKLAAVASLQQRMMRLLQGDIKQREASLADFREAAEKGGHVKTPLSSEAPEADAPTRVANDIHPSPTGSDQEADQLSTSPPSPAPKALSTVNVESESQTKQANWITYGKHNRSKLAGLNVTEVLDTGKDPVQAKPRRKRSRPQGSSSRMRKRTPRKDRPALNVPTALSAEGTDAAMMMLPPPPPRTRKPDHRKRFATMDFAVPSRFPPSRAAKKLDIVYAEPR